MSLKLQKLSDKIVCYSLKVKSGDKVLITSDVVALPLIKYLIQSIFNLFWDVLLSLLELKYFQKKLCLRK